LYIIDANYGALGYENGEQILDMRYLLCLLLEYAATLGLVDVALNPPAHARADYGGLWGTDELPFFSRYDGLMYFRITPLGAHCLGLASDYTPASDEAEPILRVLPNLEVAAIGTELRPGERLALDAYAARVSDHVWRIEAGRLLAAIAEGRPVAEFQEFLAAHSHGALPDTVLRLLADVAERSAKLRDLGLARLIECTDATLAALIAHDSRTRKHCMRAGEHHLVVPADSEAAFQRGLRELGYLVSSGEARPVKQQRKPKEGATTPPTKAP
jgi:hypothetical protein